MSVVDTKINFSFVTCCNYTTGNQKRLLNLPNTFFLSFQPISVVTFTFMFLSTRHEMVDGKLRIQVHYQSNSIRPRIIRFNLYNLRM